MYALWQSRTPKFVAAGRTDHRRLRLDLVNGELAIERRLADAKHLRCPELVSFAACQRLGNGCSFHGGQIERLLLRLRLGYRLEGAMTRLLAQLVNALGQFHGHEKAACPGLEKGADARLIGRRKLSDGR